MKKIIALLMVVVFGVSFVACGPSGGSSDEENSSTNTTTAQTLIADTPVTVNDYAQITLFKVTTGKKVTASMGGGIYYENNTDGETYVDVVLDFTNLSDRNISSERALVAAALGESGQKYTDCLYLIESNNGHSLTRYEDILPLSTVRLHCTFSVPETETDLFLRLGVKNKKFAIDYSLGETISSAKVISLNTTIGSTDYATLKLIDTEYTDDLLPTDASCVYSHYEIDNPSNTYLVVKFIVTNYTASAKESGDFVSVKAQYMNKYTYTGFTVVEDENEKGFNMYEDIIPLTPRRFYYLIEVPKTVMEKDVSITLAFDGQEYIYHRK